MGVREANGYRMIEICRGRPGHDLSPSIQMYELERYLSAGRPSLDELIESLDWIRDRVYECYAKRPVETAPGTREER